MSLTKLERLSCLGLCEFDSVRLTNSDRPSWERPSCLRLCECDCERHWGENKEKGAEPAFYGPSRFSGAKPPRGGKEEEEGGRSDPVKNGTAQVVWAEKRRERSLTL